MPHLYPLQPFRLLAVDPSLRRPAFAVLHVDPLRQLIHIDVLVDIDNRFYDQMHGYLLKRIYDMTYRLAQDADVFVREGGYITPNEGSMALYEAAGVTNMALWDAREARFADIPATQVKKLVAGHGMASKEAVADGLARFVGARKYECQDQSDAVAVGISWLMITGILTETSGRVSISPLLNCYASHLSESTMLLLKNMRKVG